jgi:hypothetical protein
VILTWLRWILSFAVVFGSAMAGILLRAIVPKQHLNDESKAVIQLG